MLEKARFSPGRSRRGMVAAVITLLGGIGLLVNAYWLYGWMVELLPWGAFLLATGCAAGAFTAPPAAGFRRRRNIVLAVTALISGAILFYRPDWRDMVLWYLFDLWLICTAMETLSPALRPGVERQQFWRWTGSVAVLIFAALMTLKPRSGLSEALTLLGIFAVAWGIYMLMIPPARE